MAADPTPPADKPYDPYAPEIVRKMAVVALVCAIAGFGLAAFCGIGGFQSYDDYSRAIEKQEAIYANWLHAWLLSAFGPLGVLIFHEATAVAFLGLGVFAAREWWYMRRGEYDPKRDKSSPGLLFMIGLVAVAGLLIFFAIVRIAMILGM